MSACHQRFIMSPATRRISTVRKSYIRKSIRSDIVAAETVLRPNDPAIILAIANAPPCDRDGLGAARPEQSRRAGFTPIEMVVVLTILGLALAIVAGFVPRRSTALEP